MQKSRYEKRFHAGKLLAAAAVCLMMFSSISDTLAINTYVRDLKGMAIPVTTYHVERPMAALTFDVGLAGDQPGDIAGILEELRAQKVKATFFLTGEWVEKNPLTAKAIVHAGHEVGRMLYTHRDANRLDAEEIRWELTRSDLAWERAGLPDVNLFRIPHGETKGEIAKAIRARHQHLISWSINAAPSTPETAAMAAAGLKKEGLQPGSIIRLRTDAPSQLALPQLIHNLKLAGYGITTITDLQAETERQLTREESP